MHKKRASLPDIEELLSARKPSKLKRSEVRAISRLPPVNRRNPETASEFKNCVQAINSLISEHDKLLTEYSPEEQIYSKRNPLILPPRRTVEAVDFGKTGEFERLKANLQQHQQATSNQQSQVERIQLLLRKQQVSRQLHLEKCKEVGTQCDMGGESGEARIHEIEQKYQRRIGSINEQRKLEMKVLKNRYLKLVGQFLREIQVKLYMETNIPLKFPEVNEIPGNPGQYQLEFDGKFNDVNRVLDSIELPKDFKIEDQTPKPLFQPIAQRRSNVHSYANSPRNQLRSSLSMKGLQVAVSSHLAPHLKKEVRAIYSDAMQCYTLPKSMQVWKRRSINSPQFDFKYHLVLKWESSLGLVQLKYSLISTKEELLVKFSAFQPKRSLNDLVKIRLDTADDDMRFYNKYLDMATLYEKCALFSQQVDLLIKPWWSIGDFRTLVRENLKISEIQVSEARIMIIFYLSSRIRKQLTVDFQGKTESEMGQQIQRLIHEDQRDGHIDTFCLDLPRFYEALVRLGHAVCANFKLSLIHQQFSYLMIHYAIKNGTVQSNMAMPAYAARMWQDATPHFELDERQGYASYSRVISNVYKDFKVNLLDNQLDERLTNGRIDLTGIFNYLVKARVLDTHKINRERQDPSNRYTLRSLKDIASSQEELEELLQRGICLSELEKTDIFQIMLLAMHGKEALIRRQSRRRDERDFALDIGEFRRFIELLVLKMGLSQRDYTPPRYPLQRSADFLMFKIHY